MLPRIIMGSPRSAPLRNSLTPMISNTCNLFGQFASASQRSRSSVNATVPVMKRNKAIRAVRGGKLARSRIDDNDGAVGHSPWRVMDADFGDDGAEDWGLEADRRRARQRIAAVRVP